MSELDTVIKGKCMDADWYLKRQEEFIKSCLYILGSDIFFGIRIQKFRDGDFSADFFCDEDEQKKSAMNQGYALRAFSKFKKELIPPLLKLQEFNWEIELYVYNTENIEPLFTLAFYSYTPAIEIRPSRILKINLMTILLPIITLSEKDSISCGKEAIRRQREEAKVGLQKF
jgi:hypothetical protein